MKSLFLLVILMANVLGFAVAADSEKDPKVAWQKIAAGALVIDVRTTQEFAQGHLPNALNIPHNQIKQGIKINKVKPKTEIVVYCKSGFRAGLAKKILAKAGYKNVYNAGGYEALISK